MCKVTLLFLWDCVLPLSSHILLSLEMKVVWLAVYSPGSGIITCINHVLQRERTGLCRENWVCVERVRFLLSTSLRQLWRQGQSRSCRSGWQVWQTQGKSCTWVQSQSTGRIPFCFGVRPTHTMEGDPT